MLDLHGNIRQFANASIEPAGVFRQTLPVIPRWTTSDENYDCLKYFTLTTRKDFQINYKYMWPPAKRSINWDIYISHQLLEIGNAKMQVNPTSGPLSLPHNLCNLLTPKAEMVDSIFQYSRTTSSWVNELFLWPRTNTSTNLTILFSLTFKARQAHTSTLLWKRMNLLIIQRKFRIHSICQGCHHTYCNWK